MKFSAKKEERERKKSKIVKNAGIIICVPRKKERKKEKCGFKREKKRVL